MLLIPCGSAVFHKFFYQFWSNMLKIHHLATRRRNRNRLAEILVKPYIFSNKEKLCSGMFSYPDISSAGGSELGSALGDYFSE